MQLIFCKLMPISIETCMITVYGFSFSWIFTSHLCYVFMLNMVSSIYNFSVVLAALGLSKEM